MKPLFFSILFCIACQLQTQAQFLWEKQYDLGYPAQTYSAVETPEHDFLVMGRAYTSDDHRILLMKIAPDGGLLWEKRFEGSVNEHSQLITRTSDDNYMLTGFLSSSIRLIKVDSSGAVIWSKSVGPGSTSGACVSATNDGGVVVLGKTTEIQGSDAIPHISVVKVDAQGNVTWSKNLTQYQDLAGEAIHQTSDGGYIIGGTEHPNSAAGGFLLKLKNDGAVSWLQKYTAPQKNYFEFAAPTSDGDYVLCGIENSIQNTTPGSPDAYIVRTDLYGGFIDFYTAGEAQYVEKANHVFQNEDNEFILAGQTDEPAGDQNMMLAVLDNEGNIIQKCVFGSEKFETGRSALHASDGAILVTGYANSAQMAYPYLVKTNMLCLTPTMTAIPANQKLSVYPNPADDIIYFELPEGADADYRVRVEDALGRILFMAELMPGKNQFDIACCQSGIYYYAVFRKNERVGVGKFVR